MKFNWLAALDLEERVDIVREYPNEVESLAEESPGLGRWEELAVMRLIREGRIDCKNAAAPLKSDFEILHLALQVPKLASVVSVEQPSWVADLRRWKSIGEARSGEEADLEGLAPSVKSLFGDVVRGFWFSWKNAALGLIEADNMQISENLLEAIKRALPFGELNRLVLPSVVECIGSIREKYQEKHEPWDFDKILSDPAAVEKFWGTYVVVVRQVHYTLIKWSHYAEGLATRLLADRRDLEQLGFLDFNCPDLDIQIVSGEGDSHDYGLSVTEIRVGGKSVFYKPYSPDGKKILLRIIDAVGKSLEGVRVVEFLDRGNYFWEPKVEQNLECSDLIEASYNLGAFTACLSLLGGNDFHFENVFFDNGKVVPIDLETIVHSKEIGSPIPQSLFGEAYSEFSTSVAFKGILPFPIVSSSDSEPVAADMSVLGIRGGQTSPVKMPRIRLGDDVPGIEFDRPTINENSSLVNRRLLLEHHSDFGLGYRDCYEAIMGRADELSSLLGKLGQFSTRFIARPTMIYGKILLESYQPEFMKDSMDRLACIYKLGSGFLDWTYRDDLINAEVRALWVGDVPKFNSELGSGRLWTVDRECVGRTEPALQGIVRRLQHMGTEDLNFNLSIIRQSFRLPPSAWNLPFESLELLGDDNRSPLVDLRREKLAHKFLEEIRNTIKVTQSGGVAAVDVTAITDQIWTIKLAGVDLYSGLGGIAVGVTRAWMMNPSPEGSALLGYLLKSCHDFAKLIEDQSNVSLLDTGFFGATGGIVLAAKCSAVTGIGPSQDIWREDLEKVLVSAFEKSMQSDDLDVVSGISGTLLLLLISSDDLHNTVEEMLSPLACRLSEKVLGKYFDVDGAPLPPSDERLVGFAHGSTGIAYALARYIEVSAGRTPDIVAEAFTLIASWEYGVVTSHGDEWRDFRVGRELQSGKSGTMCCWCHGASGALLAWQRISESQILSESDSVKAHYLEDLALKKTLSSVRDPDGLQVPKVGHSLCHSRLSNSYILQLYFRRADKERAFFEQASPDLFDRCVEDMIANGWISGSLVGVRNAGLMTGLSGTCYMISTQANTSLPEILIP